MEYFTKFPTIIYDFFSVGDEEKISYLVKDITRNVRFRKDLLKDVLVYDEYDIVDGETPELISEKLYGSPFFHWIIMLANERYNWIEDYPLSSVELDKFIARKYGSLEEAASKTKYYANSFGQVVHYDPINTQFNVYEGLDENGAVKRYIPEKIWFPTDLLIKDTVLIHNKNLYLVTQSGYASNVAPTHTNGTVVNGSAMLKYVASTPERVTCYDYEVNLNESKRRIKIINPSLLSTILKNFRDIM